jgi:hypothetical protein
MNKMTIALNLVDNILFDISIVFHFDYHIMAMMHNFRTRNHCHEHCLYMFVIQGEKNTIFCIECIMC